MTVVPIEEMNGMVMFGFEMLKLFEINVRIGVSASLCITVVSSCPLQGSKQKTDKSISILYIFIST